ncbi:hypothetical protein OG562_43260 [Streptomyces sp. NBC_01275]|uniref:hypothetical protein n=1 Tax=Streptomyces sp. NBC_01275 TaxID=2903807 RepID=UPI002259F496|nr:hypothetical protein [Streptomyces sp. NBC_01275]MCX4767660.1 hypothetical protein [Streptomyces sp. NBC_01275]
MLPPSPAGSEILRIVSDSRTPVFVTEHAGGRRVYGYWRPVDSATGRGGCYVALSAVECELLRSAGRITLGEPVTDPTKTTYRVRPARTPATGSRTPATGSRTPTATVRIPAATPVRTAGPGPRTRRAA